MNANTLAALLLLVSVPALAADPAASAAKDPPAEQRWSCERTKLDYAPTDEAHLTPQAFVLETGGAGARVTFNGTTEKASAVKLEGLPAWSWTSQPAGVSEPVVTKVRVTAEGDGVWVAQSSVDFNRSELVEAPPTLLEQASYRCR